MDIIYRIYLGQHNPKLDCEVNEQEIKYFLQDVVDKHLDSYTVYSGDSQFGVWKGKREKVTIIEYILQAGAYDNTDMVRYIADTYKYAHNQECVLVTKQFIDVINV